MAIGGVLFDIDGVLVTSWKPIAGAAETLKTFADHQIACSYLTNTTTKTRIQNAELLNDAGMAVRADEVITAAVLTADDVRSNYPDAKCFLVNSRSEERRVGKECRYRRSREHEKKKKKE